MAYQQPCYLSPSGLLGLLEYMAVLRKRMIPSTPPTAAPIVSFLQSEGMGRGHSMRSIRRCYLCHVRVIPTVFVALGQSLVTAVGVLVLVGESFIAAWWS